MARWWWKPLAVTGPACCTISPARLRSLAYRCRLRALTAMASAAVDVFYVTEQGRKITDPEREKALKRRPP